MEGLRARRFIAPLLLLGLVAAACADVELKPVGEILSAERRPAPPRPEPPAARERDWARDAVLEEINRARRRAGRRELTRDASLERAAQRHAEDMAARDYFDHQSPEGRSPRARVEAAGYGRAAIVGENLGVENLGLGAPAPEEMVERWLASPAHRRILLDSRFSESGVGLAAARRGGRVDFYWVQTFAAPPRP